MNSLITQLQDYLKLGLRPIPLEGKTPLVKWKEFTLTHDNQRYWVNKKCNWGLRTGQLSSNLWLYVVDLDSKELLSGFYESNPTLIGVPLVSTGKGWHIYLCWQTEPRTRHLAGMDIIANGYVVAPPSIHPSGKPYRWIVSLRRLPPLYNPAWLDAQIAPTPIVLVPSNETDFGNKRHTQRNYNNLPPGVSQGQRHSTLISYLGALHKACFREEEALARALAWNLKNRPPLPQDELIATVKSCWGGWDKYEA